MNVFESKYIQEKVWVCRCEGDAYRNMCGYVCILCNTSCVYVLYLNLMLKNMFLILPYFLIIPVYGKVPLS